MATFRVATEEERPSILLSRIGSTTIRTVEVDTLADQTVDPQPRWTRKNRCEGARVCRGLPGPARSIGC